ncbi:MAG TPA: PIN domain-containing protein [Candidatus Tectomicrobia bacterium]|nr:PIN domain-containing protein [Candidatus Tectomicrobia bacterium]
MPKPQIVIDTNILLAGLRSRRGYAFRLLQLVGTERFDINLSVPLVMEYESTLLRELPHLPVSRSVVEEVINFHCAIANRHQIFFLWRPFLRDPKHTFRTIFLGIRVVFRATPARQPWTDEPYTLARAVLSCLSTSSFCLTTACPWASLRAYA